MFFPIVFNLKLSYQIIFQIVTHHFFSQNSNVFLCILLNKPILEEISYFECIFFSMSGFFCYNHFISLLIYLDICGCLQLQPTDFSNNTHMCVYLCMCVHIYMSMHAFLLVIFFSFMFF